MVEEEEGWRVEANTQGSHHRGDPPGAADDGEGSGGGERERRRRNRGGDDQKMEEKEIAEERLRYKERYLVSDQLLPDLLRRPKIRGIPASSTAEGENDDAEDKKRRKQPQNDESWEILTLPETSANWKSGGDGQRLRSVSPERPEDGQVLEAGAEDASSEATWHLEHLHPRLR